MKKRNRSNYVPGKGTKPKGKSLTLQNEALTVAELLRKHIQGQSVSEREGIYVPEADHEDEDGEKFFKHDLADQEAIRVGIKAMSTRLKALEREYQEDLEKRAQEAQKGQEDASNKK